MSNLYIFLFFLTTVKSTKKYMHSQSVAEVYIEIYIERNRLLWEI